MAPVEDHTGEPTSRVTDSTRWHHASFDLQSRRRKARKIRHILRGRVRFPGARILDVGTGSGMVAAALAEFVGDGEVVGIDVVDQRQINDGFTFVEGSGTRLPFRDHAFDLAISNHVLEHVGDRVAQMRHLHELRRVVKVDGWAYVAVPNRWTLIEPHFKLPLLSWLPPPLRSRYVRLTGRGDQYDCLPLSRTDIQDIFEAVGAESEDMTLDAVDAFRKTEDTAGFLDLLLRAPPSLLRPLLGFAPTHIVVTPGTADDEDQV